MKLCLTFSETKEVGRQGDKTTETERQRHRERQRQTQRETESGRETDTKRDRMIVCVCRGGNPELILRTL